MKIFIKLILLFLILSVVSTYAQKQPFEGKITYNITKRFDGEKKELRKFDYLISYNNFKVNQQGSKDFYLYDSIRATFFNYNAKTFISIDATYYHTNSTQISFYNSAEKELKDGLSTDTKEILGYNCNKISTSYEDDYGKLNYNCWVISNKTAKIPYNFDINAAGQINYYFLHKYIPLLIIVTNDKGEEIERYEAAKIKEQKINKSTFDFPKGYTEQNEDINEEEF
jgi:hypothetical protein